MRPSAGNILLDSLGQEDLALLRPHLRLVTFQQDKVIAEAGRPLEVACFLQGGVASYSDVLRAGARIGIGMLGHEGFTGWSALLGCRQSPHEANIAVGGVSAWCIDIDALLAACRASASLNSHLLRFVQTFTTQLGRTVMSNLIDPIERRLARWLLMNHDRLEGDEIDLTHQQLGVMLGIRRASVTDTLHVLEGEQLIRSLRGRILIRDRPGLRRLAGEAYGFAEAEYCRLIGPFGKGD